MRHELERTRDVGSPAASDEFSAVGSPEAPVMMWVPRRPRQWFLALGACVAGFFMGERHLAAASAEDCRKFHQECTEARAAGYRDVGICNVERLECPADRDGRDGDVLTARGWILMQKPVTRDDPTTPPIGKWTRVKRFDSEEDCQAYREEALIVGTATRSQAMLAQFDSSRCLPDPNSSGSASTSTTTP